MIWMLSQRLAAVAIALQRLLLAALVWRVAGVIDEPKNGTPPALLLSHCWFLSISCDYIPRRKFKISEARILQFNLHVSPHPGFPKMPYLTDLH
jgi:hypothetical protein